MPGKSKSSRHDPLAELHALRQKMAARFDYDATRLMAYVDSLPLPPGIRVIDIKARKPQPK